MNIEDLNIILTEHCAPFYKISTNQAFSLVRGIGKMHLGPLRKINTLNAEYITPWDDNSSMVGTIAPTRIVYLR